MPFPFQASTQIVTTYLGQDCGTSRSGTRQVMCGIVGTWDLSNSLEPPELSQALKRAVATLRHRGPDDEGTWSNGLGVNFGHTRLSILDLSSHGHQPIVSSDGRFVMVFNGEVYNFADFRKELTDLGHVFRGSGDTEVILAAFQEWGSDAVQRFVGMFAIALWDEKDKCLRLFRDRLGVKPLYYFWNGTFLWFGSEIKAIRPFHFLNLDIDLQSVGEFLQYGYIAAPRTIHQNVRKLEPGHELELTRGGNLSISQYWDISSESGGQLCSANEIIESELEELLIDSFSYRMVSDVPVGVFLSGGIDSSLVAALLAKHHAQTIHTFTIGFSEDSYNEAQWARKVASHIGSDHTEYILESSEALQIAQNWGKLFDEPFGDSSGIPTLLVSQLASKDVKVVLSADGGDELFGGYDIYTSFLNGYSRLQKIPRILSEPISLILDTMPLMSLNRFLGAIGMSGHTSGNVVYKLKRYRSILQDRTAGALYDIYQSKWLPADIVSLIGAYASPRRFADSYPGDLLKQIGLCDIQHYLPDDILCKVDRTTMHTSIEGREPLLDHRLVEYACRLPTQLKRGSLGPKHILKNILYKYVPRNLVDRPKQGFAVPMETWLRGELRPLVDEYLNPDRLRQSGIFDPTIIAKTTRRFFNGDSHLTTQLWLVMAFEMWRQEWGNK